MINEMKRLWANKRSQQGSIEITIFFLNCFLLLCHIFSMAVYVSLNHNFMIYIDFLSLLYYILSTFLCYKRPNVYITISFIQIWIHMCCAIISFGWTPCFQNWSFAIIAGVFLLSYNDESTKKEKNRSLMLAVGVMITYFVLSVLINIVDFRIMYPLSDFMKRLLFTVNNIFSFFAIIMLAIFYTSRSKKKVRELRRKADYDELTNLYNRYSLNQLGSDIYNESKRLNKNYSVAILDIDFFKKVNDTYGHVSGDMVLKQLALMLKMYTNKGIIPGRWGGEEFLLIAPSDISYKSFLNILEKLRQKVEKTKFNIEDKKKINLTISIGATSTNEMLNDSVGIADEKLYKVKESGRNKLIG